MSGNTLYYGDNLDILRRYIKDESVDLIYLDPPFNSNATYNVLFDEHDGTKAASQIKAFEDTWKWDQAAAEAYQEVVETGGKVSQAMQAFRTFGGDNDMLAYLAMMAPRLVELKRVLKPTGSIYLHCDPTASHYLKMLMDAVFGSKYFRNEVVWCYASGGVSKRYFAKKHDTIFFYTKSDTYCFNTQYRPYTAGTLQRGLTKVKKEMNPDYQLHNEGAVMSDWWSDITPLLSPTMKERLGYPTQKPLPLLERIISASSNPGDLVLDPFCGCGTAVAAAQKLRRQWIGIDITHLAITLIKNRLGGPCGDDAKNTYKVVGEPVSLSDAQTLAASNPYQFQWWALGLVDARPVEQKKGADKGIDGRLYFHDDAKGAKTKQIIFSVKAGHTNVSHVRDLRGVVERENAEIGVLITMEEPTKPMRTEAAGAGFYDSPWQTRHPRLQIFTIRELLEGRKVDYPPSRGNVTFRKSPEIKSEIPHPDLPMDAPHD